jgi:hypothetical protein
MINVSSPDYYYPFVVAFIIILGLIEICINIVKKPHDQEIHNNNELSELERESLNNQEFLKKGQLLKKKFMVVYLICKSAMWAKAPYTFMLFSTYHKFSIPEIGVLYLIDACTALIAGPFIGVISDNFGRKFTSSLYSISNILVIFMRISGIIPLAYLAQFFTGTFGGIISTSYEAWLNFEIGKIYGDKSTLIQSFRKEIFSKLMFYDSLLSISVTVLGTILFVK